TGYLDLDEPAKAIEPARATVDAAASGGKALDDLRWRGATALARALERTGHAHEARTVIEPILHEIVTDTTLIPNRRAGAEITLAQTLWEDGGDPERTRARTLAADAEKDYQATLDQLKDYPPVLLSGLRKRLAETVEWRKRHP
ncbi:MAG TPA: hypothetical protein VFQ65_29975, partial [Kofleriaceae bacterium]|nr:hypothetical protein [Kofleriaceae bacterium]